MCCMCTCVPIDMQDICAHVGCVHVYVLMGM